MYWHQPACFKWANYTTHDRTTMCIADSQNSTSKTHIHICICIGIWLLFAYDGKNRGIWVWLTDWSELVEVVLFADNLDKQVRYVGYFKEKLQLTNSCHTPLTPWYHNTQTHIHLQWLSGSCRINLAFNYPEQLADGYRNVTFRVWYGISIAIFASDTTCVCTYLYAMFVRSIN